MPYHTLAVLLSKDTSDSSLAISQDPNLNRHNNGLMLLRKIWKTLGYKPIKKFIRKVYLSDKTLLISGNMLRVKFHGSITMQSQ